MTDGQVLDWESRYQDGNTRWERGILNAAFLAWRESGQLLPGRILVPGAGRSLEPEALMRDGFAVTVVDAAPSAVAVQQARLTQANATGEAILADLFAWEPETPFDAIYDQTCLCALPPSLWQAYAERLHRWLRPGGDLFILFMQTGSEGGPPFHCDLAAMRQLFLSQNWTWPEALMPQVAHPNGVAEQPARLQRR